MKSAKILFPALKIPLKADLQMLDVGGGGGFYSRAFESLGYGRSTYVDLDGAACRFASEKLGLRVVLNGDVTRLEYPRHGFDFIMCRHLIEHLPDPLPFVETLTGLLSDTGLLLIVCPNGASLEYLAYSKLGLTRRISEISRANSWSGLKVLFRLLSGDMLHGIDPPRHLWAITGKGMDAWAKNRDIHVEINTYPLTDPAFSPYYTPLSWRDRFSSWLADKVTSRIAGGTHLSVIIRNQPTGETS